MEGVNPYANACRDREFMWGFANGTIEKSGDPFVLSSTEYAIVEVALRAIDQGKSVVIHNPFPSTALPVAICSSYVYSRHPKIPESGAVEPMLLFPSRGYVTEFDRFHFANALSSGGGNDIIPRTVVNALSEVGDDWGLYTASTRGEFQFDIDADPSTPGAAFVDFQKDRWSDYSFSRIEALCEANPEMPVVFYTDEMGPAAEMTCDRLGVEPLEVTNTLLTTVTRAPEPSPGESDLATQERILNNGGVDINCISAVDDEFADLLPDLIELKTKLQQRDLAYIEVARVFNLLTKQAFKPKYWTRCTATNGYWDDVPTYLDRIRRRAENTSGAKGDLLRNFAREANAVQGHLNERHVLQNVVTDAIQRAAEDPETDYSFVLRNTAEVDALELAVTDAGYVIPENVSFVTRNDVSPDPYAPHFILFPPYKDSHLYQFPPSERVAFLYNNVWDEHVRTTSERATDGVDASHSASSVGDTSADDVTDFSFDMDDIESDIQGHINRVGFGGLNPDDGDGGDDGDDDGAADGDDDGASVTIELDGGESLDIGANTHVTTYNSETTNVTRKTARKVEVGEAILRIDETADDIYDVLIENAHKREAVREDESLIEDWRSTLNRGMDERGMSSQDLLEELQAMGSDIQHTDTIDAWRSGATIAPRAEGDVKRVIKLFHPGYAGSALNQIHRQVWRSVKHIRSLHRRIGRNVRQVVETEVNPSTTVSFDDEDVNEGMIRTIARDVEPRHVVRVSAEA